MDAAWNSSAYAGIIWALTAVLILMGALLQVFVHSDGVVGAFIAKHDVDVRMIPVVCVLAIFAITWDLDEHAEYSDEVAMLMAAFLYFIVVEYTIQPALGFSIENMKWIALLTPLFALALWFIDCWYGSGKLYAAVALVSAYLGFCIAALMEGSTCLSVATWGMEVVVVSIILSTAFHKE